MQQRRKKQDTLLENKIVVVYRCLYSSVFWHAMCQQKHLEYFCITDEHLRFIPFIVMVEINEP